MKKYYVYGVTENFDAPEHLYIYWDNEARSLDDIVDKIWADDTTRHQIALTDFQKVPNDQNQTISRLLTAYGARINRFALVLAP